MIVAVAIAMCLSLAAGALGNWWLAAALWGLGVIIGSRWMMRQQIADAIDVHPSQLRMRQLEHIANRDRVR